MALDRVLISYSVDMLGRQVAIGLIGYFTL